ncbi:MAG TPA: hypothetical protein VFH78_08040 [Candidatus Thermoplasmatota archaeon]|nr:hypothetical protein [Candidatus Thermoplasmatota archaeon]
MWRRKAEQEYRRALAAEGEYHAKLTAALARRAEVLGRVADRAIRDAVAEAGGHVEEDA